jgi:hypothetical protein
MLKLSAISWDPVMPKCEILSDISWWEQVAFQETMSTLY